MKLIRAKETDAPVLLAIEETAKDLIVYNWGFTDSEFLEWINTDIVYLIEEDGVMVGDISYVVKDADHAYITGLVIVPEFQRRGLARQAMNMLLDELKDYRWAQPRCPSGQSRGEALRVARLRRYGAQGELLWRWPAARYNGERPIMFLSEKIIP